MIREFAKKSLFFKRLVRKYRYTRNQPSWDALLSKEKERWKAALNEAKNGQKILIATSVGSHLAGTMIESMLAVALTLRGMNVQILLCDGVLPACLACWSDVYPNHAKFSAEGPSRDCKYCFEPAYKMYTSLGLTVHRYSEYLSPQELTTARNISSAVPLPEIGHCAMDGLSVGEHAMAGALRYFARGTLEGERYGEPILRRYFNASILTAYVASNLLRIHAFTTSVFHHGIYVPQGLIGEVCRKQSVHVVNWNPAYRKKCFIFSHDDTYHHTMMTEPIEKWGNMAWDQKKEAGLLEYLKSRWQGTEDWIWFHNEPKFELTEIAKKAGIDFSKPCVGLLTSVMWDAVLHYPSNAFPNMLEWVKSSIDYFAQRPELQLVIRIHPAEIRGTLPSRQRIADEIRRAYPVLPSNIIVIEPDSDISTYAMMMQCDSVIIYNTKTGVELTAMGIPVVVAGEAWIRNKGFAFDVDNPEEYRSILDRLPLRKRMSDADRLKARKYAYFFFFQRMIPLEFIEPSKGVPPFSLQVPDLKTLIPGQSKGLDTICDGIINKSDFVFDV